MRITTVGRMYLWLGEAALALYFLREEHSRRDEILVLLDSVQPSDGIDQREALAIARAHASIFSGGGGFARPPRLVAGSWSESLVMGGWPTDWKFHVDARTGAATGPNTCTFASLDLKKLREATSWISESPSLLRRFQALTDRLHALTSTFLQSFPLF